MKWKKKERERERKKGGELCMANLQTSGVILENDYQTHIHYSTGQSGRAHSPYLNQLCKSDLSVLITLKSPTHTPAVLGEYYTLMGNWWRHAASVKMKVQPTGVNMGRWKCGGVLGAVFYSGGALQVSIWIGFVLVPLFHWTPDRMDIRSKVP